MPLLRQPSTKKPTAKDFQKRRTFEQGRKLADDAHVATWRLYCEVFRFWQSCRFKPCRRHRRCCGEPAGCLMRGLPSVTPAARVTAEKKVIAGGPRFIPPANHMEYVVRRQPLPLLAAWRADDGVKAGGA
jgi:hypothetical protein